MMIPDSPAHRYYDTHFRFILNIFKRNRCRVRFYNPSDSELEDCRVCRVVFGGTRMLFDVSDYFELVGDDCLAEADIVFKFHYCASVHSAFPKVFPFSPVSFIDWAEYDALAEVFRFAAHGLILNNQQPHTQNWLRRSAVQAMLRRRYGSEVDTAITEQTDYWRKINSCLVSVHVPGARHDILDRGQLQYMAFGACTISPALQIDLPFSQRLLPGIHYVECERDWSDLFERIEHVRQYPHACITIGASAKRLFEECCSAKALFRWIMFCVRDGSRV
jgi:hypothetical protein